MAEYYFNFKIKESGRDFTAVSRELYAETHNPMSANSQKVLFNNNIISNIGDILHKSTQIDEKIICEACFIYGITENHANILRLDYAGYAEKIFAMPENIGDPYGGILEVYEKCFEKIKRAVDTIIDNLQGS